MRRHRDDRKGYAFRAWLWRLVPSEAWMVRIFHGLIAAAVCYMACQKGLRRERVTERPVLLDAGVGADGHPAQPGRAASLGKITATHQQFTQLIYSRYVHSVTSRQDSI